MTGERDGLARFNETLSLLNLPEKYEASVTEITTRFAYFLYHIPRGIPEYTDHGLEHSTRVLKNLHKIVGEYPKKFTAEELYVMSLASSLHDLGCLIRREDHSKLSVEIIGRTEFQLILEDVEPQPRRFLDFVIFTHSSKTDISKVPNDKRLQVLCAIFRLADACDISASRVKETLYMILKDYNVLDSTNLRFWESHLAIESLEVQNTYLIPWVYDERKAKASLDTLRRDVDGINEILGEHKLPKFEVTPREVDKDIIDNP